MKKTALLTACLMVVGPALSSVNAQGRPNAKKGQVKIVPLTPEVVGPVIYDTGTNVGFFPDGMNGTNNNRIIGNRFNSAIGGPLLATAMLTMLTVFPANSGAQSVSVAGPPTPANTAMVLDYINATVMANAFNAITFPVINTGPDFIGVFIGTFGGYQTMGLLGMSDMTINGQGFHAIEGFYLAPAMQTMLTPVPNRNAMIRAFGDLLIPVELMEFQVQ